MKQKVVHCKKAPFDIYIGRPSKWGNPFSHKSGTKARFLVNTREEAIDAYKTWITSGEGQHLLKDLHELKGKVLGCWCHPQRCHGDILSELANVVEEETDIVSPDFHPCPKCGMMVERGIFNLIHHEVAYHGLNEFTEAIKEQFIVLHSEGKTVSDLSTEEALAMMDRAKKKSGYE